MATTTGTLPLAELHRGDLPLAGGEGANLGAMLRAGLPVPPGFAVTVAAYRAVVAAIEPQIAEQLARLDADDPAALEWASGSIRAAIEAQPIPEPIADEIAGGMLSHGSVVAREYGIPAVVGVAEATARLPTGLRVRVDGGAGLVEPLDPAPDCNESEI